MAMSRKDFNSLAYELHKVQPAAHSNMTRQMQEVWDVWYNVVKAVAESCQEANPRFDREKFLDACVHGLAASVTRSM